MVSSTLQSIFSTLNAVRFHQAKISDTQMDSLMHECYDFVSKNKSSSFYEIAVADSVVDGKKRTSLKTVITVPSDSPESSDDYAIKLSMVLTGHGDTDDLCENWVKNPEGRYLAMRILNAKNNTVYQLNDEKKFETDEAETVSFIGALNGTVDMRGRTSHPPMKYPYDVKTQIAFELLGTDLKNLLGLTEIGTYMIKRMSSLDWQEANGQCVSYVFTEPNIMSKIAIAKAEKDSVIKVRIVGAYTDASIAKLEFMRNRIGLAIKVINKVSIKTPTPSITDVLPDETTPPIQTPSTPTTTPVSTQPAQPTSPTEDTEKKSLNDTQPSNDTEKQGTPPVKPPPVPPSPPTYPVVTITEALKPSMGKDDQTTFQGKTYRPSVRGSLKNAIANAVIADNKSGGEDNIVNLLKECGFRMGDGLDGGGEEIIKNANVFEQELKKIPDAIEAMHKVIGSEGDLVTLAKLFDLKTNSKKQALITYKSGDKGLVILAKDLTKTISSGTGKDKVSVSVKDPNGRWFSMFKTIEGENQDDINKSIYQYNKDTGNIGFNWVSNTFPDFGIESLSAGSAKKKLIKAQVAMILKVSLQKSSADRKAINLTDCLNSISFGAQVLAMQPGTKSTHPYVYETVKTNAEKIQHKGLTLDNAMKVFNTPYILSQYENSLDTLLSSVHFVQNDSTAGKPVSFADSSMYSICKILGDDSSASRNNHVLEVNRFQDPDVGKKSTLKVIAALIAVIRARLNYSEGS